MIGSGLMALRRELGRFSHSTFLDVFVEMGMVRFLAWLSFLVSVTVGWWRMCRWREAVPWLQAWIVLLLMSQAFSLLYNPAFAISAAALVAMIASARERDAEIAPRREKVVSRRARERLAQTQQQTADSPA